MFNSSPSLRQIASVGASIDPALNEHYNNKLTETDDNPFPLAPVEYRKPRSEYSDAEYDRVSGLYRYNNEVWSESCDRLALGELGSLNQLVGPHVMCTSCFNVLGLGRARDIGWAKDANELYGMTGFFYEASDAGLCNGEARLKELEVFSRNDIRRVQIKGEYEVNTPAIFTFASGFVQVLPPPVMRQVMNMLGDGLNKYPSRLMLIHAFDEHNPGVKWGDTTPYTEKELRAALEEGLDRPVTMRRLGFIPYWHHVYECVVFEMKRRQV